MSIQFQPISDGKISKTLQPQPWTHSKWNFPISEDFFLNIYIYGIVIL